MERGGRIVGGETEFDERLLGEWVGFGLREFCQARARVGQLQIVQSLCGKRVIVFHYVRRGNHFEIFIFDSRVEVVRLCFGITHGQDKPREQQPQANAGDERQQPSENERPEI